MSEPVLFEGSPHGWPSPDVMDVTIFALALVPTTALAMAGMDVRLSVLGATVHLPLFLPVLAAIGVYELWRLAVFRSTVYVLTAHALEVRRGVLRGVRTWFKVQIVPGFQCKLVRGDPAIGVEPHWIVLKGLGPEARDGVRGALKLPPLAEPPPPAPSKCVERGAALVVLVFLVLAHIDGAISWQERMDFDAFDKKVEQVIVQSEAEYAVTHREHTMNGRGGSSRIRGNLMTQRSEYWLSHAVVECTLAWGPVAWGRPEVCVRSSARGQEDFLRLLKSNFDLVGIDATWPER
ncbi:MAG TPA: hypothetical protein VFF73_36745 [Planctomycetota bacterium]|nr:hypothetical protein [Planctomycetota bacterium]